VDPARFQRLAGYRTTELYAIHSTDVAPARLAVVAGDPHASSYLVGSWSLQKEGARDVLVPAEGAGLRVVPIDRAPTALRIELSPGSASAFVTIRSGETVLGWLKTDGPPVVELALPRDAELQLLSFRYAEPSNGKPGSAGALHVRRLELLWSGGPPAIDNGIPCSVDAPAEGATVGKPMQVSGWAQERGGHPVTPTAFLVDGRLAAVRSSARVPRADVAAAVPEIGDASRAGFTDELDTEGFSPGRHDLLVKFEARDGRFRLAKRSFVIAN